MPKKPAKDLAKNYRMKLPCERDTQPCVYWASPWRSIFDARDALSCMWCGEEKPDGSETQ